MRRSSPTAAATRASSPRRIYQALLSGVAALVETRDPLAGDHLGRIRAGCRRMTDEMRCDGRFSRRMTPRFADLVVEASTLHDVGKATVSDAILLKPGRLTLREFAQVRGHAEAGYRALSRVIEEAGPHPLLRLACDIAYCHHERWDGGGYPRGLSGEEIPLAARIVAVADVYDALVSRRCYKEPMPAKQARRIIEKEAGSHFDPAVVEAFMRASAKTPGQKTSR